MVFFCDCCCCDGCDDWNPTIVLEQLQQFRIVRFGVGALVDEKTYTEHQAKVHQKAQEEVAEVHQRLGSQKWVVDIGIGYLVELFFKVTAIKKLGSFIFIDH